MQNQPTPDILETLKECGELLDALDIPTEGRKLAVTTEEGTIIYSQTTTKE